MANVLDHDLCVQRKDPQITRDQIDIGLRSGIVEIFKYLIAFFAAPRIHEGRSEDRVSASVKDELRKLHAIHFVTATQHWRKMTQSLLADIF